MNRKRISDALSGISPEFLAECEQYTPPTWKHSSGKESNMMLFETSRKHSTRKLFPFLLAACLILGLGIACYASGMVDSLIGKWAAGYIIRIPDEELRQSNPEYAQWLDKQLDLQVSMIEIGEKSVKQEQTASAQGLACHITMLESYYDGEKFSMACRLHRDEIPVDLTFDKNCPQFSNLVPSERDNYSQWQKFVTPENRVRIEKELQEKGCVGFSVYGIAIRDHVYVNGQDFGCYPTDQDENGYFVVQHVDEGFGPVPLPESCQKLDSIEVTFRICQTPIYYWLEADSVNYYLDLDGQRIFPISFTLNNCNLP